MRAEAISPSCDHAMPSQQTVVQVPIQKLKPSRPAPAPSTKAPKQQQQQQQQSSNASGATVVRPNKRARTIAAASAGTTAMLALCCVLVISGSSPSQQVRTCKGYVLCKPWDDVAGFDAVSSLWQLTSASVGFALATQRLHCCQVDGREGCSASITSHPLAPSGSLKLFCMDTGLQGLFWPHHHMLMPAYQLVS